MLNLSNNRIKSLAFLREGSPKNIDDSDPNASLLEMNEEEVAAGHDEHHIKSDSNIATAAAVASAASKDKLGSKELGTSVKGTKTSSETSNKRIVNKNAPRSYNGFTKLEELRLVKNLIEDYDGLLGIVALPVLQRVFLEGNPILKTKTSAVPLTAPTTSSGERKKEESSSQYLLTDIFSFITDSDILNMLPNEYGIQVCDVIYQSIRLNTVDYNLLDPKALKSGSYQDKNLSGKSKRGYTFISKKPAGAILAQVVKKKQLKHSVEPFQESKANLRRDFKYGEEDVNRMIQMGRIYTLKELEELMGSQESLGTDGSGETSSQASADANDPSFLTGLTLAEIGDEKILEESSSDNDANGATAGGGKTNGVYDPFAFDETFITGVHITDSTYGSSEKGKGESWMDEWEDMDSSDENESDSASTAANLPILPSTIQLSIRALRHAMYNPVSYERVQEASYAQPTFAYRRKLRSVGPRFNLPRYEVGLRQTGGYYDHQNVITNTPRWEIGKKKSMLPPLYSSSTAATGTGTWGNSMGYGGGYQHRAANEFEEMSNMMNQVDERLNVIEANLSTVLGDQQLRKRLPLTKSLLNEVRRVYDRIEKEYTEEAYEKLHQEELEKSATAFELLLQQTKIKQ